MTSLAIEQVEHQEVENLWIGPREVTFVSYQIIYSVYIYNM